LARRRSNYTHEKRAKEIARKKKGEEKRQRRQKKATPEAAAEAPAGEEKSQA
jgi:hypothetical protein